MRAAALLLLALAPALGCESEVPRPQPGQTCFNFYELGADGNEFCPTRACFQEAFTLSADEPAGASFLCMPTEEYCPPPPPERVAEGDLWSRRFILNAGEFTVDLKFDERLLLDGYSLENFQKYLEGASVEFSVAPDFEPVSAGSADPGHGVEFVSYEGGVLGVRIAAIATRADTTLDTPPYLCRSPNGIGWRTCETKTCRYSQAIEGSGEPIRVTAHVRAPIQPLQP